MKKDINVWDYAGQIMEQIGGGILLTTCADGEVDTMTIGWGTMGYDWSRPVFIAYVRESRYTKQLLEKNPEFTVNIPLDAADKKILAYCGTKSGRDTDKIRDLNLTLEQPEVISVPGIKELPLTLECKVLYKEEQDLSRIPEDILKVYYPKGDHHHVYYGQIVSAYIIED